MIVSVLLLISSIAFRLSETVPKAHNTIGISITFKIKWFFFFSSLAKFRHLSFFIVIIWSYISARSTILYINYYCLLLTRFSHQRLLFVFTAVWVTASLLGSPILFWLFDLMSKMLLSGWSWYILWLTILPIFFSKPLRTVPSTQPTMSITVTLIVNSLFRSLAKSQYLSIFSLYFTFYSVIHRKKRTKSYKWLSLIGGGCGVMVIVVGNGHGYTSSNPGRDWLHFT